MFVRWRWRTFQEPFLPPLLLLPTWTTNVERVRSRHYSPPALISYSSAAFLIPAVGGVLRDARMP